MIFTNFTNNKINRYQTMMITASASIQITTPKIPIPISLKNPSFYSLIICSIEIVFDCNEFNCLSWLSPICLITVLSFVRFSLMFTAYFLNFYTKSIIYYFISSSFISFYWEIYSLFLLMILN